MTVDHEVIPPIVADLPDYIPSSSDLSKAKLGNLSGDDILITADNAYQEIVTWKKATFSNFLGTPSVKKSEQSWRTYATSILMEPILRK